MPGHRGQDQRRHQKIQRNRRIGAHQENHHEGSENTQNGDAPQHRRAQVGLPQEGNRLPRLRISRK